MNAKQMTADLEAKPTDIEDGRSESDLTGVHATSEIAPVSRATLGLERWVQYVFVVFAAFFLWFFDKSATLIWQYFAEPPEVAVTALSVVLSAVSTGALYRNQYTRTLVNDVVSELSKVTWPTRKETYTSTIVVIVTSLLAAAIVGAFDYFWSLLTDLLYKHKV